MKDNQACNIHIYVAQTDALNDERIFERAISQLPEFRRDKAIACKLPVARKLSVCAGLLLGHALKEAGTDNYEIKIGDNGKPYISGGPCFNLSHSGQMAICAVSDFEVGCDIEKISEAREDIAKRFFAPCEYEALMSYAAGPCRDEFFFRLWTLKESYIKYTGRGLGTGLDTFAIKADDPIEFLYGAENVPYLTHYSEIEGYSLSVCSEEPISSLDVKTVDISK